MITITHTHEDGTLIEGSRKGDGVWEILKGLHDNWRSFRSLGQLGLGQSRGKAARTWIIDRADEALRAAGYEVSVVIDNTITRTFAEAEAEQYERAEDRAESTSPHARQMVPGCGHGTTSPRGTSSSSSAPGTRCCA